MRAGQQSMLYAEKSSLVCCQEGLAQQSQGGHFDGDLMQSVGDTDGSIALEGRRRGREGGGRRGS